MQGEVWPGGFHGEAVFTIPEPCTLLREWASLGPAGCGQCLEEKRVLNFTPTTRPEMHN